MQQLSATNCVPKAFSPHVSNLQENNPPSSQGRAKTDHPPEFSSLNQSYMSRRFSNFQA